MGPAQVLRYGTSYIESVFIVGLARGITGLYGHYRDLGTAGYGA